VLKKINRIGRKKEFLEIKNKGRMINSPLFGAATLVDESKEIKFGFVISKKISKRAVDRNKIKRRMGEILVKKIEKFKPGTKIVFLAKKSLLGAKIEEIEEEVNKIIDRRL
jgi:ribonuclease P protein component